MSRPSNALIVELLPLLVWPIKTTFMLSRDTMSVMPEIFSSVSCNHISKKERRRRRRKGEKKGKK